MRVADQQVSSSLLTLLSVLPLPSATRMPRIRSGLELPKDGSLG